MKKMIIALLLVVTTCTISSCALVDSWIAVNQSEAAANTAQAAKYTAEASWLSALADKVHTEAFAELAIALAIVALLGIVAFAMYKLFGAFSHALVVWVDRTQPPEWHEVAPTAMPVYHNQELAAGAIGQIAGYVIPEQAYEFLLIGRAEDAVREVLFCIQGMDPASARKVYSALVFYARRACIEEEVCRAWRVATSPRIVAPVRLVRNG